MTEEEAKTKWCPQSRVSTPTGAAVNRWGPGTMPEGAHCIASRCMWWRWYRTHIKNPDCPDGDLIPSTRTYGYCGIAGHWFEEERDQ